MKELKTPCILWKGARMETHKNQYGIVGKRAFAHRIAYEKYYGKIPKGLVIDHLCRNGLCINPEHLEAVSNKENILRGNGPPAKNARKTHCHNGHEFNVKNTRYRKDGKRVCKICEKEYQNKRKTIC